MLVVYGRCATDVRISRFGFSVVVLAEDPGYKPTDATWHSDVAKQQIAKGDKFTRPIFTLTAAYGGLVISHINDDLAHLTRGAAFSSCPCVDKSMRAEAMIASYLLAMDSFCELGIRNILEEMECVPFTLAARPLNGLRSSGFRWKMSQMY